MTSELGLHQPCGGCWRSHRSSRRSKCAGQKAWLDTSGRRSSVQQRVSSVLRRRRDRRSPVPAPPGCPNLAAPASRSAPHRALRVQPVRTSVVHHVPTRIQDAAAQTAPARRSIVVPRPGVRSQSGRGRPEQNACVRDPTAG